MILRAGERRTVDVPALYVRPRTPMRLPLSEPSFRSSFTMISLNVPSFTSTIASSSFDL
jgi:hypothetical protein